MLRIRYLSLYIYDCDNGEMKAANMNGGKREKRSKKRRANGEGGKRRLREKESFSLEILFTIQK